VQERAPPVFLALVFRDSFNAGFHFIVATRISARSLASGRHSRVADLICTGKFFGCLGPPGFPLHLLITSRLLSRGLVPCAPADFLAAKEKSSPVLLGAGRSVHVCSSLWYCPGAGFLRGELPVRISHACSCLLQYLLFLSVPIVSDLILFFLTGICWPWARGYKWSVFLFLLLSLRGALAFLVEIALSLAEIGKTNPFF
jgi:hypothetical protein